MQTVTGRQPKYHSRKVRERFYFKINVSKVLESTLFANVCTYWKSRCPFKMYKGYSIFFLILLGAVEVKKFEICSSTQIL